MNQSKIDYIKPLDFNASVHTVISELVFKVNKLIENNNIIIENKETEIFEESI